MDGILTPWFPGDVRPVREGSYITDTGPLLYHMDGGWLDLFGVAADPAPKRWRGLTLDAYQLADGALLMLEEAVDGLLEPDVLGAQANAFERLEKVVLKNIEAVARAVVVGRMDELAREQRRRMDGFAEQFTVVHRKLDEMRQTRFAHWRSSMKVEQPRALGPFAVSSSYTFMPNATAAPISK